MVTDKEKLRKFWKYNLNPITGLTRAVVRYKQQDIPTFSVPKLDNNSFKTKHC